MNSSKSTKILDTICVLLVFMACIVRLTLKNYTQVSADVIIFLLYITSASIWIGHLRRRLIEPHERKYIFSMALMVAFLMILRTIKYVFLPDEHFSSRYVWYLYYFPQIFMLLWMFFAALHIVKGSNEPINKYWKLLYIPAGLIVLAVITNDLHSLAFYFPNGLDNWTTNSEYIYGPIYYIALAWIILLSVAVLALSIVKCSVFEYRKYIWMPLLPLALGAIYLCFFLANKRSFVVDIFSVSEIICFIFPAFIEGLILARLFPSNDCYPTIWSLSTIGGGIVDTNGNLKFRSKNCVDVSFEQIKLAENKQIVLDDKNTVLQSQSIQAGYGYWIKDITEINLINKELEDLGDVLAEENAMLTEENKLKQSRAQIEEKNRLYDSMALSVRQQLERLNNILNNLPEDEAEFEKAMKYASIIGTYIKRHSNILLHLHQNSLISSIELRLSLTESLEYLSLCGIKSAGDFVGENMINGDAALLVYEVFQAAIESNLYKINAVLVNLDIGEKIILRIQLAGAEKLIDKSYFSKQLSQQNGSLNAYIEDETEYITLKLSDKKERVI